MKLNYTPKQLMNYKSCGCDSKSSVPGWLLDKIAEEKLTGRYNTKRSNICSNCFTAKSVNGTCGC